MASPAARERKSIAAKKCLSDIKVRSKISKASKAYWAKPGSKELKSNSAKRQWSNPAFKAKLSSLQKARRVREYMDRLDFIYPIHIT